MTTPKNLLLLNISQSKNSLDGITLREHVDEISLDKLINSTLLKDNISNKYSARLYTTEKQQLIKYKSLIKNGFAIISYNRSKIPYGRSNPDNSLGLFSIRRELRHTLAKKNFTDIDIENAHPNFLYQILNANKDKISCSFETLEDYVLNRDKYLKDTQSTYGCDRDTAKNLYLILLFGGEFKTWTEKNTQPDKKTNEINIDINKVNPANIKNGKIIATKEIIEFRKEFIEIAKEIEKNNTDLCKEIKKNKEEKGIKEGEYNYYGSICSYFLQEIEIRVLEIIYKYCITNKYIKNNIAVLCADGIMIETKNYKEELLTEFNKIVKEETGLELKFTSKEMNKDYLEILDKSIKVDLYTPNFSTGLVADYFKLKYLDKFMNVGDIVYFFNGEIWKEDTKHTHIHNFIDKEFYKHLKQYITECKKENNNNIEEKETKLIQIQDIINNITKNNKIENIEKIIEIIENNKEESLQQNNEIIQLITENNVIDINLILKILENINNKLKDVKEQLEENKKKQTKLHQNIETLRDINHRKNYVADIMNKIKVDIKFDEEPHLLAFNNKVYDLETCTFRKADYTNYVKTTTGYDWTDNYPDTKVKMLDNIINTIFPNKETKDYYLTMLSTGLYGEQIENLFIATGKGGNGKSLINSLMIKALGKYGYKLPSSVLLHEIKEGGNPQVAGMDRKRFVLCQEPNSRNRIVMATLKEITGDKTLNVRMNYSNQCSIDLKLTLVMECNELPKVDEVNDAVERRIRVIPFVSKFVSKETYDLLENKTNVYIGDEYYKSDEFQEEYKQALIMILMEYWRQYVKNGYKLPLQSTECRKLTNEYLAASDDIYGWLNNDFKLDKEENDRKEAKYILTLEEIWRHFNTSTYYQNLSKEDKRTLNKTAFKTKIKNNNLLSQYYRDREQYKINGKYIKSPILINWRSRNEEDEEKKE